MKIELREIDPTGVEQQLIEVDARSGYFITGNRIYIKNVATNEIVGNLQFIDDNGKIVARLSNDNCTQEFKF
jgi:hypothetical protein